MRTRGLIYGFSDEGIGISYVICHMLASSSKRRRVGGKEEWVGREKDRRELDVSHNIVTTKTRARKDFEHLELFF